MILYLKKLQTFNKAIYIQFNYCLCWHFVSDLQPFSYLL